MAPLWQWEAGFILQPGTCSTAQPGPAQGCYSYSPFHAVGPNFVNTASHQQQFSVLQDLRSVLGNNL